MEKRRSLRQGAEDEEIEMEGNPFEALHFPPARKFGSGIYRLDGSVTRKGEEKPNLYDSARLEEVRAGRLEATKEDVVGKLLFNFRDLKDATNTGRSRLRIKPGRVYRTACIARGDVDIDQIAKIIAYIKDEVGIRTIIDFRNKDEKQADPFDRVLEDFYPTTKATTPNIEGHPRRFHIPLMNLDFKLRGLFNLGTNKMTKLYVRPSSSLEARRATLHVAFAHLHDGAQQAHRSRAACGPRDADGGDVKERDERDGAAWSQPAHAGLLRCLSRPHKPIFICCTVPTLASR